MAHECASGADVTGCGIGRPGACRRVRRSRSERRARGRAAVVVQLAVRRLLEPRGRVRALAVVVLQSFVRMLLVEWRRGLGIFVPEWKQEQEEAAVPNARGRMGELNRMRGFGMNSTPRSDTEGVAGGRMRSGSRRRPRPKVRRTKRPVSSMNRKQPPPLTTLPEISAATVRARPSLLLLPPTSEWCVRCGVVLDLGSEVCWLGCACDSSRGSDA